MKYLPKNILTGNLYKDSVKEFETSNGRGVNFKLITKYVYKDKEGNLQERPAFFHQCVAFGKNADIILAAKESQGIVLSFEAEFMQEEWEKDGVKRYSTKVNARWVKAYAWNADAREWEEQELVDESAADAANEVPF